TQLAVRRHPRQRRTLERGKRNPTPRLRRQQDARLRAFAGPVRSGRAGPRRAWGIRRASGRPAERYRARPRQRQARMCERDDRERRRSRAAHAALTDTRCLIEVVGTQGFELWTRESNGRNQVSTRLLL